MVANLIKSLLVLFVFLVMMKNSEHQFTTAKSVPDVIPLLTEGFIETTCLGVRVLKL